MNPWNVYMVGFHDITQEIIILTCQTMYVSIVGIATERNINYISKTWGKTLVSCVAFNTSMCTIAFISFTEGNVACITNIELYQTSYNRQERRHWLVILFRNILDW
jgi:hypothetical protein